MSLREEPKPSPFGRRLEFRQVESIESFDDQEELKVTKRLLLALTTSLLLAAGCATVHTADNEDNQRDPASDVEDVVLRWSGQRKTDLNDKCRGQAELIKESGQFKLWVHDTQCSNIKIGDFVSEKIPGSGNDRAIKVNLNTPGWHHVSIVSNKGNGSSISIEVPPQYVVLNLLGDRDGKTAPQGLPSCGGTVRAQINRDGTLAVIFSGVNTSLCNKFDILSNDGDKLDYDTKTFPNGSPGYTIPPKFIRWDNDQGILLSVYHPFAGNERILVRFSGKPAWWPF